MLPFSGQGEITTVPLPLDTTTERSRSIVVNSSEISFEVDTSSHNNKFVIGIVIAGEQTMTAFAYTCTVVVNKKLHSVSVSTIKGQGDDELKTIVERYKYILYEGDNRFDGW